MAKAESAAKKKRAMWNIPFPRSRKEGATGKEAPRGRNYALKGAAGVGMREEEEGKEETRTNIVGNLSTK